MKDDKLNTAIKRMASKKPYFSKHANCDLNGIECILYVESMKTEAKTQYDQMKNTARNTQRIDFDVSQSVCVICNQSLITIDTFRANVIDWLKPRMKFQTQLKCY